MKILHVITGLKLGGAETALYNLLSKMVLDRSFFHEVACFHDGPYAEKIRALGIQVHHVQGAIHRYDPFLYQRLRALVMKLSPHVIHSSLWSANMISCLLALQTGIPLINDLHGNTTHEGLIRNMGEYATRTIPDALVAVSAAVKKSYQEAIGFYDKKLIVIRNGIDVELVRDQAYRNPLTRVDIGLHEQDFVVGSIGRFEKIKSYDLLIKSFADLYWNATDQQSRLKLCLVGDGSQRKNLELLVWDLGIRNAVIFPGFRTDGIRFYPLFDCFALSSLSEGLSIALLEALCCGLPIITTNQGNDHEVIVDGVHGYVVPVGDQMAYTHALNLLLNNAEKRSAMRHENERLINQFDIRETVDQYRDLYRRVKKSEKY